MREEGGISEQQYKRNRTEIETFLHEYLPKGVYDDYATLAKLDKTCLYRLFSICEKQRQRQMLTYCIKITNRLFYSYLYLPNIIGQIQLCQTDNRDKSTQYQHRKEQIFTPHAVW